MASEQIDPKKYHVLDPVQKKIMICLSLFAALVLIPILSVLYFRAAANRPAESGREMAFEIKSGENVPAIAQQLQSAGAVNSQFLFIAYVYLNGLDKKMQSGAYRIKAGSSVAELAQLFQHGVNDTKITFLEGWRLEEVALKIQQSFDNATFDDVLIAAKGLEGYLYPDTYYFNKNATASDIVSTLNLTFSNKTQDVLTAQNLANAGMTKEQVVTLASIVERETNTDIDRPIVAGILINRWKTGMKLDADATTQYATATSRFVSGADPTTIKWWPSDLTLADLNSDSAYNTRKDVGLPPYPICNPSLSSIQAVLNAQKTGYLYYLTDNKGIMHYAKTLEEHNKNISLYLGK